MLHICCRSPCSLAIHKVCQQHLLFVTAGKFAAMVCSFCERLKWCDLEALIQKFQVRVWFGVRQEIVALTEIPYVKGARARLLYKAGLRTPEAVAECDVDRLTDILVSAAPNGGGRGVSEDQQRRIERRAAKMILNVSCRTAAWQYA